MIEELKILLGDRVSNYSDELLGVMLKRSIAEVESYCQRELDYELESCAVEIAICKLNRMGTEGINSMSMSGISETYESGYPSHIQAILNRKRRVKVL